MLLSITVFIYALVCVANGAWQLVWQDEFNGTTLNDTEWNYQTGGNGWGNGELEYYTSHRKENARIENGHLVINVKVEDYEKRHFTSARLNSKTAWAYGKFEARAKLPKGKNLWPAIWMMPQDSVYGHWAASGEIDIMEYRGENSSIVMGTIHYGGPWPHNLHSGGKKDFKLDFSADWHLFGFEWEKKEMRWYVDGEEYHKENIDRDLSSKVLHNYNHTGAPFDEPFHWNLNVAVGGNFFPKSSFGPHVTPEEAKHWAKATMEIDYVRVYKMK